MEPLLSAASAFDAGLNGSGNDHYVVNHIHHRNDNGDNNHLHDDNEVKKDSHDNDKHKAKDDDHNDDGTRLFADNLSSIAMTLFASMGFLLFGYHLGFSSATEYDIALQLQLTHSQVPLFWLL
jgi:ABC-type Zn2+ transport system substrate-binding protein/surface adhesin